RDEIISAIKSNQVVIIAGETGSGKTTQLPKMCLDAGQGVKGLIGHTQPRRLAARTVSTRIAEELSSELGSIVGYKVRFQDNVSENSYIKLMTDGILLAEIQQDRYLERYDTIIIDEAHERSLNIDFLLGYLKTLLRRRKDLKLIITSATIDHERFSSHFENAPIIVVSGRTYPVTVFYQPMEEVGSDAVLDSDAVERGVLDAIQGILDVEQGANSHLDAQDILVFLPGEREIRNVADLLRRHLRDQLEVLPLYSRLSNAEQNRVFAKHANRRVVLATNVAETSITVPNIGFVVDPGTARVSRYSYRTKVHRLPVEAISQASANQRMGRCGRIAPGICIRLYDEESFLSRDAFTDPEILRSNLASVILQMKSLRLGEVGDFPFINPPDEKLINDGYRLLSELGAVGDQKELTGLGRILARLPVDPRVGRMLIAANDFGCLKELISIGSGLSLPEPWSRPHEKRAEADLKHKLFKDKESDFLAFVNLWDIHEVKRQELSAGGLKRWYKEHFISYLRMREWRDLHRQLKLIVQDMGWKLNQQPADYQSVHQAILTGYLSHVGMREEDNNFLGTRNRKFNLFPGSSLSNKPPKWMVAAEIVETHKVFARTVAKIDPEWIESVGKSQLSYRHFEPHWEKKRAAAVAFQESSLFGLVVSPKKKIDFSLVDTAQSREIFIYNALVAGDYFSRAPFHIHNRKLVDEIGYLEDKSRRRDILVDDLVLYGWFDERLPDNILNGKGFEKWRKNAERKQPACLFLSENDVIAKDVMSETAHSFPDNVEVSGGTLKIDYLFEPGKKQDGINVVVPVTLINQLNEASLEWLVPGLELEKCIALMKSLPKAIRKNYVPVPDVAGRFLQSNPDRNKSLIQQLTQFLRQQTRIDIKAGDWNLTSLSAHLKANVQVVDAGGKLLQESRDIASLKLDMQASFKEAISNVRVEGVHDKQSKTQFTSWDFDNVPEAYEFEQNGAQVKTYPALVDHETYVSVHLCDAVADANSKHQKGILRLCMLGLPQQIKYLKKHCSLNKKVALQYAPFGSQQSLADGIAYAAFYRSFIHRQALPRTRDEFSRLLETGRAILIDEANVITALVEEILSLHHQVSKKISGQVPIARVNCYQDIKQQLRNLFVVDWIGRVSYRNLQDFPRYLKAVLLRIDRLQGNIDRDKHQADQLKQYRDQYEERQQRRDNDGVFDPYLDNYRWMLEEYRVSLFAQGMKTAYPVSEKRLNKLWEDVLL
ncbi:MAG: ATP-dependent RNA helicase HrpA, partial [Moraxellaceae bacterium]